jgi:hypothetical protein
MPDIKITDSLSLTADLKVNDSAALAKAGLKDIISHTNPFVAELNKPLDQCGFKKAIFGAKFSSPSALLADATNLVIHGDVSGVLSSLGPDDKKLFEDDFTPEIPIAAGEYWISLEIDTSLSGNISSTVDGIGVAVEGSTAANFATCTLVKASGGKFPSLKDALTTILNSYSVDYNVAAVRGQPAGTVRVNDLHGHVKFSGSYSVPVTVNSLASVDLAFNQQFAISPNPTLKLSGELQLTGDFVVRSHRVNSNELHLGIYKKKGSSFKVAFTASAGVAADVAGKDLISTFFGAVLNTPDLSKIGITGDDANTLNGAIKDCVDHNLAISLNAICSAAGSDEAAVAYSINLAAGDAGKTDAAIASALHGDWSALVALPNKNLLRDITGEMQKIEHKVVINLLGLYNAESVDQFVKSCAILHDDGGQVLITDKVTASHLAVASLPFLANTEKLRSALAEAFLATVSYVAGGSAGAAHIKEFTASQTYFNYWDRMSRRDMVQQIALGEALKLIPDGSWDGTLRAHTIFGHARVSAAATYDATAAMKLFFKDPATQTARSHQEFEEIGRRVMAEFIDPNDQGDPTGRARLSVLQNDAIWAAMNDKGAVAGFNTIDGLQKLSANELSDVGADWTDITWWADAMTKVAPKLSAVLSALKSSTAKDPTTDPNFMKKRKDLQAVLGQVTRNSRAAFAGGWGIAVMETVCQFAAPMTMDINADGSIKQHYTSGSAATAPPAKSS